MASVLVLLASGCEELEAVTVIDLLRRAQVEVVSAGLAPQVQPVTCSRGTVLVPDTTLDKAMDRDFDMVVMPGGQPGTDNLRKDFRVVALVKKMAAGDKYIAAICAAPMVLAEAGVLAGKTATCYPGCLDEETTGTKLLDKPVVTDGKVITSRGPGTAMDFSLELVATLTDRMTRDRVEAGLQRPKR